MKRLQRPRVRLRSYADEDTTRQVVALITGGNRYLLIELDDARHVVDTVHDLVEQVELTERRSTDAS